jgi:hypothetical protein
MINNSNNFFKAGHSWIGSGCNQLLCPTEESGLLMSSLRAKKMFCMRVAGAGVRENARYTRQLALSKGPEWMGNSLP